MPKTDKQATCPRTKTPRRQQKPSKPVVEIKLIITETRLAIEFVGFMCHAINFGIICSSEVSPNTSWTLLTLCITTIGTLVQFQTEGKSRYIGNPIFSIPIAFFSCIVGMIIAAPQIPVVANIVSDVRFAKIVSGAVTVRQFIHWMMLRKIYIENIRNREEE